MAYRVVPARRLEVEAVRVQGILELHEYKDTEWEVENFVQAMEDRGLEYTQAEMKAIATKLIADGVIEEVP